MGMYRDMPRTFVIQTYNRAGSLGTLVDQIERNVYDFGHQNDSWGITVVDDSPPGYATLNQRTLAGKKRGLPVYYFGPDEFGIMASELGDSFYTLFDGNGAADTRNLAIALSADKWVIIIDDDMRLTETVSRSSGGADYPSLLSTGEFYPVGDNGMWYRRDFDVIGALTSHLGRKVGESGIIPELMGEAVGNRDEIIDRHLSGNEVVNHAFSAIEQGEIDPDATIMWQGVSAITGKTDCHATASIQGIGSPNARDLTAGEYSNLAVNYALHDRSERVGLATRWRESTLAAFGILNTTPFPSFPLRRGGDVSYRQSFSPSNPVALSSHAIDHDRSLNGRHNLARLYFHELMGAKACKSWHGLVERNNGNFRLIKPQSEMILRKSSKRSLHRSIRQTCEILDHARSNDNHLMAAYAGELLGEIGEVFYSGRAPVGKFWENGNFKDTVFGAADQYFSRITNTLYGVFDMWPELVKRVRTNGIPIEQIA